VSQDDLEFVRELGADRPIDYKNERFEDAVRDVDLVFDLVNGATQDRSWAVLKRGGAIVCTLSRPSEEKARSRGARAEHYMAQPNAAELRQIAALIDAGKLIPRVQAIFPFCDVQEAQQQLEHGHVQGKIVLDLEARSDDQVLRLAPDECLDVIDQLIGQELHRAFAGPGHVGRENEIG
jgi:NADPH:quinone reductase-like Zn-dependent oxidoreductase